MDTASPEPLTLTSFDASTGEIITRELTAEEIAALPEAAQLGEPINE